MAPKGGSSDHAFDTGNQFSRVKWLVYIVVGSDLKTGNAVAAFSQGAEKNDRRSEMFADEAAARQAVFAGEHYVQDDQVELTLGQNRAHLFAVLGHDNLKTIAVKKRRERLADFGMVVDDEDSLCVLHGDKLCQFV